jgi:hypothetical protein
LVFAKKFSSNEFKCSASDALSIYKVVRVFLMSVVLVAGASQELRASRQNYFLLCSVLDLLTSIGKKPVTPTGLMTALLSYFTHFKRTYGEDPWIPKFHLALHLPSQLARHSILLACFTQERKHKEVKRYGEQVDNASKSFEKGIMESVLHLHLRVLQEMDTYPCQDPYLVNPHPASSSIVEALCQSLDFEGDVLRSNTAFFGPMKQCSRFDVVSVKVDARHDIGQVWFHVDIGGTLFTCVSFWDKLGSNQFRIKDDPVLVLTSCIMDTCCYRRVNDTALVAPQL